jgi:hypothetical protein
MYLTCPASKIFTYNVSILRKNKKKLLIIRLLKPTELQNISTINTINNEGQSTQVVHTDFHYVYYDVSSKQQEQYLTADLFYKHLLVL